MCTNVIIKTHEMKSNFCAEKFLTSALGMEFSFPAVVAVKEDSETVLQKFSTERAATQVWCWMKEVTGGVYENTKCECVGVLDIIRIVMVRSDDLKWTCFKLH